MSHWCEEEGRLGFDLVPSEIAERQQATVCHVPGGGVTALIELKRRPRNRAK